MLASCGQVDTIVSRAHITLPEVINNQMVKVVRRTIRVFINLEQMIMASGGDGGGGT